MIIAVNGQLCEDKEAVVSVYDHGFLYGMGLFETFRTYGGRPFLLDRHLRRLAESCGVLGIAYRPDLAEAEDLIARLLAANGLTDAYIRLSVSAGTGALGLPSGDYGEPTVVMYMKPLPPRDAKAYAEGKPIQRLELRRNSPEGSVRLKSFHYMNNILAKREMNRYPWAAGAEGIFLNERGFVAEGIVSNLFWIKDRVCFTPSVDTGILPGITRGFVLELAADAGLPTREGHFVWSDVIEADEAFLTNSIQEIVPVGRAFEPDGREWRIGSGGAGPLTQQLMARYRASAGGE